MSLTPKRVIPPNQASSGPLLAWTLCGLLLAQQLLPLQLHTRWLSDGQGHVLSVCTLQPDGDNPHPHDDRLSAAVVFSDLMSGSVPTLAFSMPLLSGTPIHTPATPWPEAAPTAAVPRTIRAPPLG